MKKMLILLSIISFQASASKDFNCGKIMMLAAQGNITEIVLANRGARYVKGAAPAAIAVGAYLNNERVCLTHQLGDVMFEGITLKKN